MTASLRGARVASALLAATAMGCGARAMLPPVDPATGEGAGPAGIEVRWRRLLAEAPMVEYKPQEFSTPASDGHTVYAGAHGGTFFALDRRDGSIVWRRPIGGGVSGRPVYVAEWGSLLVGSDDGVLHRLDAKTGAEQWSYRTRGPITAAPVVDGGHVFFTNGENRLFALEAATGTWQWQYEREPPEGFTIRGMGGPLATGGRVYAGFSDGYVVALDQKTGDALWSRGLAGDATRFIDADSTPVLAGGTLYVSSYSGGVYALDPDGGAVKWRFPVEGAGTVVVDGPRVYFAATREGVHCVDTEGRVLWRQSLAQQGELSEPSLVDAPGGRLLVVSASQGGAYVIEAAAGRLLQYWNPGKGVTAPASSDGTQLYVITNTAFLYAFDLTRARR